MRTPNLRSCEDQLRYATALLPDEKRIIKSYRNDRKLIRMMDCKQVNKFDKGNHVYQPVKKQKRVKFLNLETADLYVRSGAVLLSDCVSKERIIMDTNGRFIGFIRNDVMLKLFRKYAFDSEQQLGTNKTKYRFAV